MAKKEALITASQCKAARGLLGWTQEELAEKLGVTRRTIHNFEHELRKTKKPMLIKMRKLFMDAGVELIEAGETSRAGGGGARWRDSRKS